MHPHLARRHRRKLLFPPGLLALAGLLWLGCVAVGTWREKLSRKVVIQLTMPIYPATNERPTLRFELPDPDSVCTDCSWSDAYFTGNSIADKRQQIRVEMAMSNVVSDSAHGNGVRIHFAPASRYKHLIFVLSQLEKQKVKRFWLDIHYKPTTLYAFREPPRPPDPSLTLLPFECLLCGDVRYTPTGPSPIPFWVRFDDSVTVFWRIVLESEWRASIWWLVIIAALSSRRIVRAWRVA